MSDPILDTYDVTVERPKLLQWKLWSAKVKSAESAMDFLVQEAHEAAASVTEAAKGLNEATNTLSRSTKTIQALEAALQNAQAVVEEVTGSVKIAERQVKEDEAASLRAYVRCNEALGNRQRAVDYSENETTNAETEVNDTKDQMHRAVAQLKRSQDTLKARYIVLREATVEAAMAGDRIDHAIEQAETYKEASRLADLRVKNAAEEMENKRDQLTDCEDYLAFADEQACAWYESLHSWTKLEFMSD